MPAEFEKLINDDEIAKNMVASCQSESRRPLWCRDE